jgi:hypothetical protein
MVSPNCSFEIHDLDRCCRKVIGALGSPGERPGFAVMLGVSRKKCPEGHHICLLDECESPNTRELVWQCGRLNSKWKPGLFVGDTENGSIEEFIYQMNKDNERPGRGFVLSETLVLTDMKPPHYPYMLGTLRQLRDSKHRRLELKESRILSYMSVIESSEEAKLQLGDFPAIEALMFGVIELLHVVANLSARPYPERTGEPYMPEGGEFDHLFGPGAHDPGPDDDDFDEESWYRTV